MNIHRKEAVIVGALFILSTLTGVLSVLAYGDLLQQADFLTAFSESQNRIILGTFLELICAAAFVGVSIFVFPVLAGFSRPVAIGYVVGRSFEAVPFIISIISTLSMITLSQEYLQSGLTDPSLYLVVGAVPRAIRHWANIYGPLLFCGIAALPFYFILWRRRLIPLVISVWGFLATFLYLAAALMSFWGITSASSSLPVILIVPFAVNEMVLAVYLIARGFKSSAFAASRIS